MSTANARSLQEMEGEVIVLLSPFFHQTLLKRVKLHKVEDAGLWIESQEALEIAFKNLGLSSSPKTMIFFLPWHQITTILSSVDSPSISEKSLGL
jgi:hypothetical protein